MFGTAQSGHSRTNSVHLFPGFDASKSSESVGARHGLIHINTAQAHDWMLARGSLIDDMPTNNPRARRAQTNPIATGTYTDFMSRALAMELAAAQRYTKFADQLKKGNHRGIAEVFRKLAKAEGLHAKRILTQMGWPKPPPLPRAFAWEGIDGPETAPLDCVHDSIQPPEALNIALRCETRAQKYFEDIALSDAPASVRDAAAEMASEERDHTKLIESWLVWMPRPLLGWD